MHVNIKSTAAGRRHPVQLEYMYPMSPNIFTEIILHTSKSNKLCTRASNGKEVMHNEYHGTQETEIFTFLIQ